MRTLSLSMPGGVTTLDLISVSSFDKADAFPAVSLGLSPAVILLFHRLTCFDLPLRAVGKLRTDQVWLADRKGNKATHTQPPDPREVPKLLGELCNEWNMSYAGLSNRESKLEAIARFHAKLLLLHPFLDGNGRVARAILMQQCLDLFEKADLTLMNKGADYYEALRSADDGDYSKLVSLIDPIIRS